MSIKIITDSGSDLSKEIRDDYDIDVMPIIVTQGSETYLDGVNIDNKKLYADMRAGVVYKTAARSPIDYENKFTDALKNYDRAIYVALSSKLSSTYEYALLAKKTLEISDDRLLIVDSLSASIGEGLLVYHLAKRAKEHEKSFEELEAFATKIRDNVECIFYVDSLEYLKRGGRVSTLRAAVGGLLKLKVILDIGEGGVIAPVDKVRGEAKAIKRMLTLFMEKLEGGIYEEHIIVAHADASERAHELMDMVKQAYPDKTVSMAEISSTIGAHCGPGTVALFAVKNFE